MQLHNGNLGFVLYSFRKHKLEQMELFWLASWFVRFGAFLSLPSQQ